MTDRATDLATTLADLQARDGWTSSSFRRSMLIVRKRSNKTAAEMTRLDRFMPGWRSDLDDATLTALRVGVQILPIVARAHSAGTPWRTYDGVAEALSPLIEHEQHLSPAQRALLVELLPRAAEADGAESPLDRYRHHLDESAPAPPARASAGSRQC